MIANEYALRTVFTTPEEPCPEEAVVELPLLLPRQQLDALETAARAQGLTMGQMIRRLIAAYLQEPL